MWELQQVLSIISNPYQISLYSLLYAGVTLGRTRTHTLTAVQWGGRGGGVLAGVAGPSPYFDFASSGKAFDLLYNTKYILCVVALLEVCDVTKHACHLVFFQELEIRKKQYN